MRQFICTSQTLVRKRSRDASACGSSTRQATLSPRTAMATVPQLKACKPTRCEMAYMMPCLSFHAPYMRSSEPVSRDYGSGNCRPLMSRAGLRALPERLFSAIRESRVDKLTWLYLSSIRSEIGCFASRAPCEASRRACLARKCEITHKAPSDLDYMRRCMRLGSHSCLSVTPQLASKTASSSRPGLFAHKAHERTLA